MNTLNQISTITANPADWKSRFALPERATAGERVQVKTLLAHPMESGYRRDFQGEAIPRNIIKRFECHYLDTLAFVADLFPAVAANPYLSFHITATETGTVMCRWIDQHGMQVSVEKTLRVTPK